MKPNLIRHAGFRVGRKDDPLMRKGTMPAFSVKADQVAEDGTFSGYASVFGEVDSYNEIVVKGAFKKSLKQWAKKGQLPRMLWMHNTSKPIGIYTLMKEDDHGLYVEGKLALDTVQGAEAYALLKLGALDGLSIGYVCTQWLENSKTGETTLEVIDLWEVSLVTFPAGPTARVNGVKSAFADGKLPTKQEYVDILVNNLDIPEDIADALASKGIVELLRQRGNGGGDREVKLSHVLSAITGTPFIRQE